VGMNQYCSSERLPYVLQKDSQAGKMRGSSLAAKRSGVRIPSGPLNRLPRFINPRRQLSQ